MGGDYFALCVALHELARVDSSVAITLEAAVSLGAMPLFRFGIGGAARTLAAAAVPGRPAGRLRADRAGRRLGHRRAGCAPRPGWTDGDWVIDGTKAFITNAGTVDHLPGHGAGDHRQAGRGRGDLRRSSCRPGPRAHRRAAVLEGRLVRVGHAGAGLRRPAGCPPRTCSASGAAVTPSSCRPWTRAGSRSRRWRPGWPRAASTSAWRYVSERTAFGRRIGHYQAHPVQDRGHGGAGPRRPAGLVRRGRADGRGRAVQEAGRDRQADRVECGHGRTRARRPRSSAATAS